MTILVVDDEKNIADGVAYTLNAEPDIDAEVRVCYGAQSAKDYAEAHFIDLIVCDIDMPRQNGLSLCKDLLARYPRLKVIFLTGYSNFSYAYEALKLPDVSYVLKLEDDSVLLKAVKEKIAAIEEESRRKAELAREKQINSILSAQLGDMRLKESVAGDAECYCDCVFLFMRFNCPDCRVREFACEAFAGNVSVSGEGAEWLAAIEVKENVNVTAERAKILQQELFDATGIYSVFVFDRPCREADGQRYRRLKQKSRKNVDALYFSDDFEGGLTSPTAEEDETIARVSEYIVRHLDEELSLTVLSELVHYNPAYLSRKFKQVTGENLHAFILNRRLALAKKLLAESDEFVQDIAIKCGFTNPTQFGIAFGKFMGCSPSAFRRRHLKN